MTRPLPDDVEDAMRLVKPDAGLVVLVRRVALSRPVSSDSTASHYVGIRGGPAQAIAAHVNRHFVDLRLDPQRAEQLASAQGWKLIRPNTRTGTVRVPSQALADEAVEDLVVEAFAEALDRASSAVTRPVLSRDGEVGRPSGEVPGKGALVAVLRAWLESDPAGTLSARGSGAANLNITVGDVRLFLSGDTTQEAVRQFLEFIDAAGKDAPWDVLANRSGKVRKVGFGGRTVPGWYLYLREPWGKPGQL